MKFQFLLAQILLPLTVACGVGLLTYAGYGGYGFSGTAWPVAMGVGALGFAITLIAVLRKDRARAILQATFFTTSFGLLAFSLLNELELRYARGFSLWVGTMMGALAIMTFFLLPRSSAEALTRSKDPVVSQVIQNLRDRAENLRRLAWLFLALVIASISAALTIFVLAQDIIQPRPTATASTLNRELSEAQEQLRIARKEIEPVGRVMMSGYAQFIINKLILADQALQNVTSQESKRQEAVLAMQVEIDRLKQVNRSYMVDVGVLSLRVAITVLVLFLVRVLLQAYRDNLSLAAFYDAKADILQLRSGTESDDNLTAFLASLHPGDLAHRAPAPNPVEELSQASERLARSLSQVLQLQQAPRSPTKELEAATRKDS
jgi:hypothetical protein